MIVLVIVVLAGIGLLLGARLYAPVIGRVLGERHDRMTPAVALNDGRDYVPTKTPVVFAHHYASIAGAGPIVGPVLAILYGWGPALLWLMLGGIFLGAVHDYVATHRPGTGTRQVPRMLPALLRHYWVNSGIAVALMLTLGLGNGYTVLWKIFGSANQLLAALTLLIGSCWLLSHHRPVSYTLLPAAFMLVTSVWMLLRLIGQDLPNWPAKAPLVVTEFLVLAMTAGIVALAVARWHRTRRQRDVAVASAG